VQNCPTMQADGGVGRPARRRLDIRWPLRGVGCLGAILIVACTFFYGRHVGVTALDTWIPAAVAASAGWLCLVLFALMVWACVRISRGLAPFDWTEKEPARLRREWVAPLLVGLGVLIGLWIFK